MILLNLIETHLSSWRKFTHNHWKEIWLLVNQCVGTKGHKKLLKLFRQKNRRKARLKQGQNCQGKKKGIYGVNWIIYEKVILEHILTAVFTGVYPLCVTQAFLSEIRECTSGQITFQMSKFFTQKKVNSMYCAEQQCLKWKGVF